MAGQHFGKYRGQVWNNIDPLGLARIQVTVAQFTGIKLNWAMPCLPWAGDGEGFYAVPSIGANVWIEFEGGDLNYPVWTGCFWEVKQTVPGGPNPLVRPLKKIFKTKALSIELDDTPAAGGITIEANPGPVKTPLKIKMDASGITVDATPGKVTITPTKIEVSLPPGTATFDPKKIALQLGGPSIAIEPASISLTHGPSSVALSPKSIDAANGASKLSLTAAQIASTSGIGKLTVAAAGVQSQAGPGKSMVGPAGASIQHGAANVNLNSLQVSVNNSALSVT